MKGNVKITSGQHYAEFDGHTTWRWQGWNHPLIAPYESLSVQVHHFKWDSTAIKRIRKIALYDKDFASSDEYHVMYRRLRDVKFKIPIEDPSLMFERCTETKFELYKQWNKLIKKIVSI